MFPEFTTRTFSGSEAASIVERAQSFPPGPSDASLTLAFVGSSDGVTRTCLQKWNEGVLVEWKNGDEDEADIVLRDDGTVRIQEWSGDLLGTTGTCRKDMEGWEIDGIPDAAVSVRFGERASRIYVLRWLDGRLHVVESQAENPSLELSMSYGNALDWLWGDLLLGHLLWRNNLPLTGNFFVLSAIEGIVSASSIDPPPSYRIDKFRILASLLDSGVVDGLREVAFELTTVR